MNDKFLLFFYLIYSVFLVGCEKDDIRKREAEALTSFEGKLNFENVEFTHDKNGSISMSFIHKVKDSDISLKVLFKNIEPVEGTTNLVYQKIGGGSEIAMPTSYMFVIISEDGLGELYITDSTAVLESTLHIDCITKNKITGEFQVSYDLSDYHGVKFADWIPNKFSFTEGVFDARKY